MAMLTHVQPFRLISAILGGNQGMYGSLAAASFNTLLALASFNTLYIFAGFSFNTFHAFALVQALLTPCTLSR